MLNDQKRNLSTRLRPGHNWQPLTSEELELLYKKRFIDEAELLRLLRISTSTMYKLIRSKELVPAWLGSKKMFDMEELYYQLEQSKTKGRIR